MSALDNSIEALVDSHDLHTVMEALATVLDDKAEHLAGNWQDHAAARCWSRAARILDTAAFRVRKLKLDW
jgi:hypothetical protein